MEHRDMMLLAIGRLEGKVDALIERSTSTTADMRLHEERINRLERYRSWLLGASATIGVLASYAFQVFTK